MMSRKAVGLALVLLIALSFNVLVQVALAPSGVTEVSGSGVSVYFSENQTLCLGTPDNVVNITVTSGAINSSSSHYLVMSDGSGAFGFRSTDNATLRFEALGYNSTLDRFEIGETASYGFQLKTVGATKNKVTRYIYTLGLSSNTTVNLNWRFTKPTFFDIYLLLGIGVAGAIIMIVAVCWLAYSIRKHGFLHEDTFQRGYYSLLLFVVGLGMVLSWLGGAG